MKCSILKEEFLKGLNVVSRISAKSITLPILNNVLISCEKNFVVLSTTDLEIGVKYWILSKVEKTGSITVPAKFLLSLVSLISDEKINLEIKNNTLLVESKNFKNQIKGLDAEEFPIIPEVKSDKIIEVKPQLLTEGFSQIVDTASVSQTRPEISGVFLALKNNNIEMAATDSFRLAEKKVSLSKKVSLPNLSVIVPQKTIREIINIFSEKIGKVKIYFSPTQIMFESLMDEIEHPYIRLVSRLIEGEYPNYKEIIPDKFKTEIILQKQEFLNQIKTASLFSGKINEVKLKINPDQGIVEIFAQDPDLGQSRSFIKTKIKGKKEEVVFNHRFLTGGLSNIRTKEIIFGINGGEGPGIIKPVDDDSFLYVVMPIKNS